MAVLTAAAVPVTRSCALSGALEGEPLPSPATADDRTGQTAPAAGNGQALTDAERAEVLKVINTDDYADLAICPTELTTRFAESTPRRRSSRSGRPAVSASCITGTGVRPRRGSDHRKRRDGASSFPLRDSPVLVPESIVWQLRAS